MTRLVIVCVGLWSAPRGGVKEKGMSASADSTINQDCRGMKIGGWGSGRTEQSGACNVCLSDSVYKTIHKPFWSALKTPKCGDQWITLLFDSHQNINQTLICWREIAADSVNEFTAKFRSCVEYFLIYRQHKSSSSYLEHLFRLKNKLFWD